MSRVALAAAAERLLRLLAVRAAYPEIALARRILLLLILLQILSHLFWLSPAAHSGQVAIPWMMNEGLTLFDDIWEQHAPGASLLGALAQQLAPPALDPGTVIKWLNTLLVVAFTLLIYALAQRLTRSATAGLLAALVWAWWEPVYGNVMLYFDTLLALCLLAALIVYFRRSDALTNRDALAIGLLMGTATLFKQHAWLPVAVMGFWLLLTERRSQVVIFYAGAVLLFPLLQVALLLASGNWENYLFWNWTFNLSGTMDGFPLDGDLFRKLLLSNMLVFPFALLAWTSDRRREFIIVLLWLSTLVVLYPRFGEIHAMGHLPFTALMSGIVLAKLLPILSQRRDWDLPHNVIAGLAFAIGLGWLWTGAVSYIPLDVGAGQILAYAEFETLAAELNERKASGDTLYVLPETDSTPQLHPLTKMLPPGTWIKGWRWYFRPDHVVPHLLDEWDETAPTWIVVFPALIRDDNDGIKHLLARVERDYELQFTVADIFFHGPAQVFQLRVEDP